MLQIKNLIHPFIKISYDSPIDLSVQPGTCIWLNGENGSGKSTFLSIIAGIIPIEETIKNPAFFTQTPLSFFGASLGIKQNVTIGDYKKFVGFDQNYIKGMWESFTENHNELLYTQEESHHFENNLCTHLVNDSYPHSTKNLCTHSSTHFIYKLCTCELDRKEIKRLSSGQQIILRLLGALRKDRTLWLLDEPTRFLDSTAEAYLWHHIKYHMSQNGSAIIALHGNPPPISHTRLNLQ